jgi:hypothetical protein
VACDNKTAVDLATPDWLKIPLARRHVDLIRAIRKLKANLPVQIRFRHVYSHQDDTTSFENLDRWAQLNAICDQTAKAALSQMIQQDAPPPPCDIAGEGWSCWIAGVKQTSSPAAAVRRWVFSQGLQNHLHDKGQLD